MRKLVLSSLVLLFIVSCGSGGGSKDADVSYNFSGLLVPAYFKDETFWDVLEGAPSSPNFYVVVNPSNGPGTESDPFFSDVILEFRRNGKSPIGYVYTSWGERPLSEVESDVDRWLGFYPEVSGFFFDEVSVDSDKLPYYRELYRYVKSKGKYTVVLNPGTLPSSELFSVSDLVVIFEADYSNLKNLSASPDFKKSACIVTGVPKTKWKSVLNTLNGKCSFVYITLEKGSNPYGSLPDFFSDEVKAVFGEL